MNAEQIRICTEEIASLLGKGAITQVTDYGFISGFLLVPKASGGLASYHQSKGSKSFHTTPAFQNGGRQHREIYYKERGLVS